MARDSAALVGSLPRKKTCVSIDMVQAPDAVSNQRHRLEAEGAMALIEIGMARWHSPQDAVPSRNGSTPFICRNVSTRRHSSLKSSNSGSANSHNSNSASRHRLLRVAIRRLPGGRELLSFVPWCRCASARCCHGRTYDKLRSTTFAARAAARSPRRSRRAENVPRSRALLRDSSCAGHKPGFGAARGRADSTR